MGAIKRASRLITSLWAYRVTVLKTVLIYPVHNAYCLPLPCILVSLRNYCITLCTAAVILDQVIVPKRKRSFRCFGIVLLDSGYCLSGRYIYLWISAGLRLSEF